MKNWYTTPDAKRARVKHLAVHFRLGDKFTKCGKRLGKLVKAGDYPQWASECQMCLNMVKKERPVMEVKQSAPVRLIEAAQDLLDSLHDDHENCYFCEAADGQRHDPDMSCGQLEAALREAK